MGAVRWGSPTVKLVDERRRGTRTQESLARARRGALASSSFSSFGQPPSHQTTLMPRVTPISIECEASCSPSPASPAPESASLPLLASEALYHALRQKYEAEYDAIRELLRDELEHERGYSKYLERLLEDANPAWDQGLERRRFQEKQ